MVRVVPSPMRRLFAPVLLAATLSCGGADSATAPGTRAGELQGSVTSAKSSIGVPNLVVALMQDGHVVRASPTDATGAFAFAALPAGEYVVRITGQELAGVSARHTAFSPEEQRVQVDGKATRVFIAAVGLIPPRIVGVVSCGGVPVTGARVRVVGGETDVVVVSNEQGKYGATDLASGRYAVMVESAPCRIEPAYRVALVRAGQAMDVDFAGG